MMFSITQCLQAHLGETEAEIIKAYGKETGRKEAKSGDNCTCNYKVNGLDVTVTFTGGKSHREWYCKPGASLTGDEIQSLLAGNTMGSKWTQQTHYLGLKNDNVWNLEDGKATATSKYGALVVEIQKRTDTHRKKGGLHL